MIEHYFVAAWVPPTEPRRCSGSSIRTSSTAASTRAGVRFSAGTIAPGATGEIRASLYVGPQDQDVLAKTAKGLDLVVDYGIFTVLAAPLFIFLKWLHGIIGNWGWAIVVMTIMIKAAFYPLNAAAARSMAKMKIIAPKMKALQEQYANDKQQLQIKMMEMYKTEKINPLGGCLPILVQIPVFIALYWVLLSAVELRQAPWILWIHDLSAPDPVLRAARDLRDHRVPAGQALAHADHRSRAGEGDADHADRVLGAVHLLPVGARAVLARQQHPADRASSGT